MIGLALIYGIVGATIQTALVQTVGVVMSTLSLNITYGNADIILRIKCYYNHSIFRDKSFTSSNNSEQQQGLGHVAAKK